MPSFSKLSTDDTDDWAGLSGLSLSPATGHPAAQSSPPITGSSAASSGEYNAFAFVGGLVAGGGDQTQPVDIPDQ